MVRLEGITKIFNEGTPDENLAIASVDLEVWRGDFITVIGSNGAGKTTLFNLIAGTVFPTAGRVLLDDTDISKVPEYKRARSIGRIFQDPLLGTASNMTLEDNMMICLKKGFKGLRISLTNRTREFFREQLKDLDMGLEHRLKENVRRFSGGQRQALTLLMMVLSEPELILLDEHTAALDPKNAALVLELTEEYIRRYNLTAMMVTHNMGHAIEYGNRLIMMDRGEIILDIRGEEKKTMTIDRLVEKFHQASRRELESDEVRLSSYRG
mgnify:CR=1 FL=1